jgi:hypothetical protein
VKYFALFLLSLSIIPRGMIFGRSLDSLRASADLKPSLFIDGNYFGFDYVRREVSFVNYVRDRNQADIYLLITLNNTGSKGKEYILAFKGVKNFSGINDTLKFNTISIESDEKIRNEFINTLKRGLVPFINHTDLGRNITISYKADSSYSTVNRDEWDSWVFNIHLRGRINGEKNDDSYHYNADVKADRITYEWKFRFSSNLNYDEENYNYENDHIESVGISRQLSAFTARSLSGHTSLGTYTSISSSTYNNIKRKIDLQPALEYDIFPYEDSNYREFLLQYKIGYSYIWYLEETIFNKKSQAVLSQEFDVKLSVKQYWGYIHTSLSASNFLNDFLSYRINLNFWVSLNLVEGFSLDVGGGYSKINDQITIPKSNLSLEDILLQKKELETNYSYYFEIGFGYTFGSIYNNIVNPRFDD